MAGDLKNKAPVATLEESSDAEMDYFFQRCESVWSEPDHNRDAGRPGLQ